MSARVFVVARKFCTSTLIVVVNSNKSAQYIEPLLFFLHWKIVIYLVPTLNLLFEIASARDFQRLGHFGKLLTPFSYPDTQFCHCG